MREPTRREPLREHEFADVLGIPAEVPHPEKRYVGQKMRNPHLWHVIEHLKKTGYLVGDNQYRVRPAKGFKWEGLWPLIKAECVAWQLERM
jgi:hypothetical protein